MMWSDKTKDNNQFSNFDDFRLLTIQNSLFQSRDHFQKTVEHRMLLTLSIISLRNSIIRESKIVGLTGT